MCIPRTRGLLYSHWQPLRLPSAITHLSQLYQSPHSGAHSRGSGTRQVEFPESTSLHSSKPELIRIVLLFSFFPSFFRLSRLNEKKEGGIKRMRICPKLPKWPKRHTNNFFQTSSSRRMRNEPLQMRISAFFQNATRTCFCED